MTTIASSVHHERVAPAEAQAQWRQVGEVCVSAGALAIHQARSVEDVYQPGELHDLLTARACALGGETDADRDVLQRATGRDRVRRVRPAVNRRRRPHRGTIDTSLATLHLATIGM
jgi:hypothetical protein